MRNKAGSRTSAPDPALFSAQLAEVSLNGGWLVERRASCIVFLAPLLVAFLAINTVVMLFTQLYAYADEPGGDVYLHGDLIWCGETPECKQSMAMCRARWGCR